MKKTFLFALFGFLFVFIGISVFAQEPDVNEALKAAGLSGMALFLVGTLITVVGKLIPQKWTDPMVYAEKIVYALYAILHKINEGTNNLSKSQRKAVLDKRDYDMKVDEIIADAKTKGRLRAFPIIIGLLMLGSFGVNAQSFKGFFTPVELNPSIQKMYVKGDGVVAPDKNFTWLFRPAVELTATSVNFRSGSAETKFLSSVGTGVSLAKYITVDEKPYCQLSLNLLLLTGITVNQVESTSFGAAGTIGLFNNIFNGGVGYLDKGFVLLIGTSLRL